MAVFGNVVLLTFGLLLTEISMECLGELIPKVPPAEDCECGVMENNWCLDVSCMMIACNNIKTEDEALCAEQYIRELLTNVTFTRFTFFASNLKLFPENFFEDHPLADLIFYHCSITDILRRLIDPVCNTLDMLVFRSDYVLKTLEENAFGECTGLRHLHRKFTQIEELSSMAFRGLSNLKTLDLSSNKIATFDGLEGIPQLRTLSFLRNELKYVAKDAFQNLSNLQSIDLRSNALTTHEKGTFDTLTDLTSIDLPENPFNCSDCSLKWLQDWSKTHELDAKAYCEPDNIPLKNKDMSHCPRTSPRESTSRATGNALTDIAANIWVLFLQLFGS